MKQVSLFHWLARPSRERGIHFAERNDRWTFWSYARLADAANRAAGGMLGLGLRPNDRVAVLQGSTPEFVASFFGTLIAGGIPAAIAPPDRLQSRADYRRRTEALLMALDPTAIIVGTDIRREALGIGAPEKLVVAASRLFDATPTACDARKRPQLALIQFTSGSSAFSRAVCISLSALEAHLAAVQEWLAWTEDDVATSWLPLHHDMGLIGSLLGAVVRQSDLFLLDPEQFVRSPLRFLRCFGERGAHLGAIPNFGLDFIVRRVRPDMLTGMDFSRWRVLVVGSERVRAQSLSDFQTLLAPFGFQPTTLSPAYGLAEATLAVTGLAAHEKWSRAAPSRSLFAAGSTASSAALGSRECAMVVGCGRPLPGITVTIEGESGQTVPEGVAGEIVVRGPSVAAGYWKGTAGSATRFRADGILTGDFGFVRDGQLFVLGRRGDAVKVRGRAIFAEDLEDAVFRLRVPRHHAAALLGWHQNRLTAVILLQNVATIEDSALRSMLQPLVGGAKLLILHVPRKTILRTSSGKIRRAELWRAFCEGTLETQKF
jgi:acyl-CoA synthetase (AMP-forming)/AMP-acid ligase II